MKIFFEEIKEYFKQEQERWVVWIPVLFGSGIGFYFLLPFEPSKWLTLIIIEALLLAAFLLRYKSNYLLFVSALLIIALGFANIEVQSIYKEKQVERLTKEETIYLKGRIIAIDTSSLQKARLLLDQVEDFENKRKGKFRITLSSHHTDLKEGQCVEMIASVMPNFLPILPQAYQFDRKAFFEGLSGSGYAQSKVYTIDCDRKLGIIDRIKVTISNWRKNIVQKIHQNLPKDEAGIAAAIITGDKTGINKQITENYRNSGLAHFLSISGLHMSMIAGLAFFALRLLLGFIYPIARRYDTKKISAIFAILLSFVYLLISSAQIPSQRAFIMTFVVLMGLLFDRRAISIRMLSLAALVILIISPYALISAGFQMSFAAVLVLVAFYENYASMIHKIFSKRNILLVVFAYILGLLISDFVASLATLPFAIYHFNQIAIYTTIGNLAAGPIIGFIIMPFVLLSMLLMPLGWEVLPLKVVGFGISCVNHITDWVSHLPNAGFKVMAMPFWGLMAIVLGGLWICLWKLKWRRYGMMLVLIGLLSFFTVQKPDVLYDIKGTTIALKDNFGNIIVMPKAENKWVEKVWQEKMVSQALSKNQKKKLIQIINGKEQDPKWLDLICDEEECIYKTYFVWQKNGKISLSGRRIDTILDGGGVVFINNLGIKKKTICQDVGYRMWNSCTKNE